METMKRRSYQLGRRAESADETRRLLVQATFELHGEQGIAATTMKQIADRAGVGVGTVYHHFASLDDTIAACALHVQQAMPMPTEAIFAGIAPLRERVQRLARALFGYFEQVPHDIVLADQDKVPVLKEFVAEEQKQRIALTSAALAPFAVDRDLIRVVAALLDVAVYRSLQRSGLSLEQATAAIADVIHARLVRKD
jgi:AcrR family transcriptional regulator